VEKPVKGGLVRGIRRWDLVAIAINGIIGAGIFGLPAKVFSLIGSYSLIAFVVCALVVTLIILCFAEVGSRFKETGGPYLYARETFGPTVAFEIGWLIWLARLTAFAANCNLLVNYIGYFWPQATTDIWRASIIVFVVVVLAAINVVGVRQAAIVSNCFTIGKLIPILVFIAAGLFFLKPNAYALGPLPTTAAFSQSVLLLIYAFTGFEMAAIPAGEVRDPQRYLPRALIIAIGVVAFLYILIQVVCVGTLPELGQSQKPLSGSRIPFAMAEQRELPSFIGRVHRRFSTPHVSILITAAIMLIFTLKSSFVAALTISAIARLVTYGATCAALPFLRRKAQAPATVFRLPGGTAIAILSLILIVWLLANSTWREALSATAAGAVGLVFYLSYRLYARPS
jgi:APA family basic amino acid/polyamine antiporter